MIRLTKTQILLNHQVPNQRRPLKSTQRDLKEDLKGNLKEDLKEDFKY